MNTLFISLSCIALVGIIPSARSDESPIKFDGKELEKVLDDDQLLGELINCLVGEDNCNRDGQIIKCFVVDLLLYGGSKLSEHHTFELEKFINQLVQIKPDFLTEIQDKVWGLSPESTLHNCKFLFTD
ncbi:hypothetical protein QAD02_005058 [Eretmocerus hayati]|uniref:Uncharacterized protein n=1 Tax=Eretmocerus hayati TaxID=131215 RepID=A0ACC2NT66_9HYME|nr:hypothetical protein QAD02_005058 [Eretmocerus hayati]